MSHPCEPSVHGCCVGPYDGEADGAEPVGKRLGFLVQEMHREANTIGSKANDSEISHDSVRLKEEVERIREQVENIE